MANNKRDYWIVDWSIPMEEQIEKAYKACAYSLAFNAPMGFESFRSFHDMYRSRNREISSAYRNKKMWLKNKGQ